MAIQSAFTLNANEIFATLANMIISQEVFADNLGKHQTLVDKARVDGSMYGDKKLYYATDVLKTREWGKDGEAGSLLSVTRPAQPQVQDITLDVFRQIDITIDNYLTKRAWSTEGAFSSFNSVILGWIRETKQVYDGTNYNVFIGTTVAAGAGQNPAAITIGANDSVGQIVAKTIADLLVDMSDYSRTYNDYGFLRSYDPNSVKVIWNSKFVNEIKKIDMPTIFHKDGLVDKLDEDVMPAKYFGTVNDVTKTAADAKTRSLVEQEVAGVHYFAGEAIPAGTALVSGGSITVPSYQEDEKIICKVVVKLPPYMSGFEVGTSFFNPRSLTENHYLTFGHNTLAYLKNYPFITLKQA